MSWTLKQALIRYCYHINDPIYGRPSYSAGTASVTNGSAVVTLTGATTTGNMMEGQTFNISGGKYYHIWSIDSSTQFTLSEVYAGTTAATASYKVTGGRVTLATSIQDLNLAQRELVAEIEESDENYFATTGTISYVSGTELYNFPTTNGTIKHIIYVKRTDTQYEKELYPVRLQDRMKYLIPNNVLSSLLLREYYYLLGLQVGILPIPTTTASNNITVHYVPEATDLTLDTSTSMVSDDLAELWIVKAALKKSPTPELQATHDRLVNSMRRTILHRQLHETRYVNEVDDDDD